ncbi:MAG: hypothetical protein TE42_07580, partial [Candidatus Synechococcus spongiarum SP3]
MEQPVTLPMPALPAISEWLPSGVVIGFGIFLFGVVRSDLKASEARQQEALKAMEARLREDLKASEERQREEMRELRADMKALGEKVDRL